MDAAALTELSRLAELLGPFFFSVLLIVVVTRTAHKYYMAACTRTEPPETPEEVTTYRRYFYAITASSILLVFASVGWWFYQNARQNHTYQVVITEIGPRIKLDSPYFTRHSLRMDASNSPIADVYFLVVQNRPFQKGDRFELSVWIITPPEGMPASASYCGGGKFEERKVTITHQGRDSDRFRLELKGSEPRLVVMNEIGR